jgi:hypothetical protein
MDRHGAQDYSDMEDVAFEPSANAFETKEVGKIIDTSTKGVRHPKKTTKNNNMKSGSKGTLESEVHVGASCGVSGYMMLILIH